MSFIRRPLIYHISAVWCFPSNAAFVCDMDADLGNSCRLIPLEFSLQVMQITLVSLEINSRNILLVFCSLYRVFKAPWSRCRTTKYCAMRDPRQSNYDRTNFDLTLNNTNTAKWINDLPLSSRTRFFFSLLTAKLVLSSSVSSIAESEIFSKWLNQVKATCEVTRLFVCCYDIIKICHELVSDRNSAPSDSPTEAMTWWYLTNTTPLSNGLRESPSILM